MNSVSWFYHYLCALSFAVVCLAGVSLVHAQDKVQNVKDLNLRITHPGFASKEAEEHALTVQLDQDENPVAYHMQVKSVFCSDEKCDVIMLRMEWDALGRFKAYRLPSGNTLTKYDHEPFEKLDYAKFNELMKNRGSILADLEPHHIIVRNKDPKKNIQRGTKPSPKEVAGKSDVLQKVDAISGATATYIQEEVVEGAAYTCYTMWHWANGDTSQQIRQHAQDQASLVWLKQLLGSKDTDKIDFALEALVRRELYAAALQDRAKAAAQACSFEGYKVLANYLTKGHANPVELYQAYAEILRGASSKHRIYLFGKILNLEGVPPVEFCEQVGLELANFETFYELQLFLHLVEKHRITSDKLSISISKMLEHENFFFARRAYAHLSKQQLPLAVREAIERFGEVHRNRL